MIALALIISTLATYLLVRFAHVHARITGDVTVGPQKFHTHQVSRVGGLAIVAGFAAVVFASPSLTAWQGVSDDAFARSSMLLMLCSLPALAAGLAEDVTKRVGVRLRLMATMLAAGIAYFALDGVLDRVDVAGLDWALGFAFVSLGFTMFAVGGIANAINIVDGYNGLASVTSILVFGALAYVAYSVGDSFVLTTSLAMLGAVAGFLPWNYPKGRIFLGDGGAYFVGFMIGELSVLLVRRHTEVSPWFPLMLVAYPVWETLFSIYRKKVLRGQSPGEADGMHFHQLVYKRVARWRVGSRNPTDRLWRNSLTSPYLWLFSLTTIIPAVVFWRNTVILGFWALGFAFLYVWLYRRMTSFRVPQWLVIRTPEPSRSPVFTDDWEASESRDHS